MIIITKNININNIHNVLFTRRHQGHVICEIKGTQTMTGLTINTA